MLQNFSSKSAARTDFQLLIQVILPYLDSYPADSWISIIGHSLPSPPSPLLELLHSHGPSAIPHDHGLEPDHVHLGHDHDHGAIAGAGSVLNPHAAWFAAASVVIKEWLYRITTKVAAEEHSPVLKANAVHHRADALTSLVALSSILGSSIGGWKFLDPLGGLAVSFFILQQGLKMSKNAMLELLDAGVDRPTQRAIEGIVNDLVDGQSLLGIRNVRGVKSGGKLLKLHTRAPVSDEQAKRTWTLLLLCRIP